VVLSLIDDLNTMNGYNLTIARYWRSGNNQLILQMMGEMNAMVVNWTIHPPHFLYF